MILMGLFLFLNFPMKHFLFAGADRCGSRQPTCHHFRERGPFGSCFMQIPRFHVPKWVYLNVTNHQDVLEWVDFPPAFVLVLIFFLCVLQYSVGLVSIFFSCSATVFGIYILINIEIFEISLEVIIINDKEGLAVVQQSTVHWWSMLYNDETFKCIFRLWPPINAAGNQDLTICVWFFRIVSEKPKRVSWRSSVPEASEISNAFIVH